MRALFVHGMGRTPLSGWPLARHLRQAGIETSTFGYSTTFEDFSSIQGRLAKRLTSFAEGGSYILIGHSLGGVLLRSALASLAPSLPRPRHLFLLGSPVRSARLARRLSNNRLYRLIAGDSGQLLASDSGMSAIPPAAVPTTAIIGTRTIRPGFDPFGGETNDGIVSRSEVDAPWLTDRITVRQLHTLLPSSAVVADAIVRVLVSNAGGNPVGDS